VNPSPAANLIESSRAYDPAGRLASVTDSMGNTTAYTYTDNGLTATITRTNAAGTSSFVQESDFYDAAGNLIQKVTNNGATTTKYTVDAADRTTSTVVDPAGVNRITAVAYTPDDRPGTVTHSDGSGATQVTSATYDPMGNLTSHSLYSDGAGHPAGWWRLNQTSGTMVPDASGTGNTASASSNVTWSGGAASFPGASGQQIATNGPVLDTTTSFSVSAWVNLAVATGWQTVVGQDGKVNSGFNLQLDSTTGRWNLAHNNTDATGTAIVRAESSAAATTGVWTHLAGTYNTTTGAMDLYVNGQLSGTATATAPWAASGPLSIGRGQFSGSPTDLVHGQIADVQVYQRVLSAPEVASLYGGGRSGGTTVRRRS
jgi:YD repeat-containing protein